MFIYQANNIYYCLGSCHTTHCSMCGSRLDIRARRIRNVCAIKCHDNATELVLHWNVRFDFIFASRISLEAIYIAKMENRIVAALFHIYV